MIKFLKILLNIALVFNLILFANDSSSVNLNKTSNQGAIIKSDKSDSTDNEVQKETLPDETLKNLIATLEILSISSLLTMKL